MSFKRFLVIVLALALCCCVFLTACGDDPSGPDVPDGPDEPDEPDKPDEPDEPDGIKELDTQTIADIKKMNEVFDTVFQTFNWTYTEYEPDNPRFFWIALFVHCSNYGDTHPAVIHADELTYILPTYALLEYAGALFGRYDGFLPMPEDLIVFEYDPSTDTYKYTPSKVAQTSVIARIVRLGDERFDIDVDYYEYGKYTFTYVFTIEKAKVSGASELVYKYTVTAVTPVE